MSELFPPSLLACWQCVKLNRIHHLETTVDYLRLADRLGQIDRDVVDTDAGPRLMGFLAWLRAPYSDLWRFGEGRMEPILELPEGELVGGDLLFMLDLLAERPGWAYHACRKATRLPGVRYVAGWRTDGRLRKWRTRWALSTDSNHRAPKAAFAAGHLDSGAP